MPWTAKDAKRKTKKARSPVLQALWAKIANRQLEKTGSDASAIRVANYVVAHRKRKRP